MPFLQWGTWRIFTENHQAELESDEEISKAGAPIYDQVIARKLTLKIACDILESLKFVKLRDL